MEVNKMKEHQKSMDICGKKASVCGFSTEFSKCGLSHPNLDQYRQAVVILNAGNNFFYLAYGLDIYVHAGMPTCLVSDYIEDLTRKGHTVVSMEQFSIGKKHIIIVGSNEAVNLQNKFIVYNSGAPSFTKDLQ
eukprot:15364470-Ditylum_brightwellii.AAC.1